MFKRGTDFINVHDGLSNTVTQLGSITHEIILAMLCSTWIAVSIL